MKILYRGIIAIDKVVIEINIKVNTKNTIREISPILYGLFFEDINYGADGGLYSELIVNRSFEFFDKNNEIDLSKKSWDSVNTADFDILIDDETKNKFCFISGKKGDGIRNCGFCNEGFAVKINQKFNFNCYARCKTPTKIEIRAIDKINKVLFSKHLVIDSEKWGNLQCELVSNGSNTEVFFEILLLEQGEIELDFISLTPKDTYKNRSNGLRKDLVELLEDINPKFLRFPGGCIVEGRSFPNMYNWKDTVGDIRTRKINWNRWQLDEYQPLKTDASDYFQSFGLGYYEYFLLCEDLGAKPIPVMNVGMTCQWHESLLVPLSELDKFVQDVLDLIEFANGSIDSKWGELRNEMGHPEPFNLEYIGIGNEQWGEEYFERYEKFYNIISENYPNIKLITSAGWTAEGKDFDYATNWMKKNKEKAYCVDEHFYKSPEWFLNNINRYDNYDRTMPKVFAGEYAAHTDEKIADRKNNWYSALTEAAFLTGVEKNSDHVIMSCYAPLIARSGYQQWQPNLIWFNKTSCYGTPNYYVQKLFSNLIGDKIVETIAETKDLEIVSSISENNKKVIIKIVNINNFDVKAKIDLDIQGFNINKHTLCSDLEDVNTFENPKNVYPKSIEIKSLQDEQLIKAYSVVIYEVCIL